MSEFSSVSVSSAYGKCVQKPRAGEKKWKRTKRNSVFFLFLICRHSY